MRSPRRRCLPPRALASCRPARSRARVAVPDVTCVTCVTCGAWQVLQDLSDKQHPYIVSLHHSFQDDAHLYLVMDFVGGGLPACAASDALGTVPWGVGRGGALALGCSSHSGEQPLSPAPYMQLPQLRPVAHQPRAKV